MGAFVKANVSGQTRYFEYQPYRLREKASAQLVILFFLLVFGHCLAAASVFRELRDLEILALECLETGGPSICRQALLHAEVLQRHSNGASNYPCQTRLLGLQGYLLMSSSGQAHGNDPQSILDEVMIACKTL